jgi:hypothetical protein
MRFKGERVFYRFVNSANAVKDDRTSVFLQRWRYNSRLGLVLGTVVGFYGTKFVRESQEATHLNTYDIHICRYVGNTLLAKYQLKNELHTVILK